jgi:hypothetical protein
MSKLNPHSVLPAIASLALMSVASGVAAQPVALAAGPAYAVATFTDPTSPNNAGDEATIHMSDWTRNGWVPMGIAAQYSEHELEGTTVKATPLWAVHVLMTCTRSRTRSCRAPMGPVPHP